MAFDHTGDKTFDMLGQNSVSLHYISTDTPNELKKTLTDHHGWLGRRRTQAFKRDIFC